MSDREYMQRAIELAAKAVGWTNPNPLVGAVIVKDGRIIGEGYHKKCGELHAERNAIASLKESAQGATIYVTLEPCCHYGKTPPCTEAIIEQGIKRVVIGSRDPNPLVAGKGAKVLREHGIIVEEDFMREECDALNPVFFHYIVTKKPYVAMKYAMTLDGKIATHTGASQWITGEAARGHVHALRGKYAAIMAGIGTVLADDPMLNCRVEGAHQPMRVIVDSSLRIPLNSKICKTANEYNTVIACAVSLDGEFKEKAEGLRKCGINLVSVPDKDCDNKKVDMRALMEWLGEQKIDSVFVEGGGQIHEALLTAGIVNHVYAYIAPKLFGGKDAKTPVEGKGVVLPNDAAILGNQKITNIGDDILLEYDVIGGMNGVYWNC